MKEEIFTFPKHHLELSIKINETSNYLELSLKNLKFHKSRLKVFQLLFTALLIYLTILFIFKPTHFAIHIAFLLFTIGCFYSFTNILEKEVVKALKGFGLQHSAHYAMSRTRTNFIPSNNIYRTVINEVIYFNQVIYVLQVLTDKEFHRQTPIVVLFDNLLPPLDCLKLIYNKISSFYE